jgi:hypothetical protein
MPPVFISVEAIMDGKKVGGENGMFVSIDDTDERTCPELLLAFLKDKGHGDASVALPEGSTMFFHALR